MPAVIFTSAYDQYAIRAFEVRALDYLLKPFDQERLHHAIERARRELGKSQDREITHRILDFSPRCSPKSSRTPPLKAAWSLEPKGEVVFLNLSEIDWIEASANYVRLNVGKESHLFRENHRPRFRNVLIPTISFAFTVPRLSTSGRSKNSFR